MKILPGHLRGAGKTVGPRNKVGSCDCSWCRQTRVGWMYVLGQEDCLLMIRPVPGEARFIELAKILKGQIAVDCWVGLRRFHYSIGDTSTQVVSDGSALFFLQKARLKRPSYWKQKANARMIHFLLYLMVRFASSVTSSSVAVTFSLPLVVIPLIVHSNSFSPLIL